MCFALSILAALGLFAVYAAGGQTQAEGALLAVALGGIGAGLALWAKKLMAGLRDETQPRHHVPTEAELTSASDTVEAGVEEIRRRTFLSRLLLAAAAALGLAALFPIRSLGRAPGDSLTTTKWTPGARLVTVDGEPVRRDTLETDSFTTVFPEGFEGSADSQAVLISVGPGLLQLPPGGDGGSPRRVGGLLQDLHARRVPARSLPRRGAPVALPLPSVHLRRPGRRAARLRSRRPSRSPSCRSRSATDGVLRAKGDFTGPVGPSFWSEP